jgi:hypothetical protein
MTNVLSEIERQKRLEQAKAWDHGEMVLATRVMKMAFSRWPNKDPAALHETNVEPSQADEMTWKDFVAFAEREGVRHLPAKSQTVAAYLLFGGIEHEQALDVLAVIVRRHDKHGLSNPCATHGVRVVLEFLLDEKAPRSWRKDEQELWAFLPADIRHIITRRELNRDKEVRRVQGELGIVNQELITLKKSLNAENQTEETRTNGLGESHQATAPGM